MTSVTSSSPATAPQPHLRKFHYSFFAPEIAPLRSIYFKILASSTILTIIVSWAFLPLYWGSLADTAANAHHLRAWVINRDGGEIGSTISSALLGSTSSDAPHLGWELVPPDTEGTDDDIANAIVNEEAWVAVVIEDGASDRLVQARQTGDRTYNPSSAITVYTNIARNEIAGNSFIVPFTSTIVNQAAGQYAAQSAAKYLAANAANTTAIQLVAAAPQTLSSPVLFKIENLRPYTATVANAVTLVGQIYVIIFAFILTMSNDAARAIVSPYLTTRSYIKLRLFVPLIAYLPLSLSYAMVSLPFKLPFGATWSYAGGFFIFVALIYVGMCALGLATEAIITLLGPRFMAFFLIPWIIVNVSTTVVPFELQNQLYKYGYGFPVFNMSQAVRTIIFNTKSHLGANFGVLIGWAVLSSLTIPLFTWLNRRSDILAAEKEEQAGVEKGKPRAATTPDAATTPTSKEREDDNDWNERPHSTREEGLHEDKIAREGGAERHVVAQ